eukprot:g71549.t1
MSDDCKAPVEATSNSHNDSRARTIPRVIYQTGIYPAKHFPTCLKRSIAHMRELNPGYEWRYFSDQDEHIITTEHFHPELDRRTLAAYRKLGVGAAKADLWRYQVLYRLGGVYVDLDATLNASLDELIQDHDQAIVSRENLPDFKTFVQWMLIYAPGHPVLERLIASIVDKVLTPDFRFRSAWDVLNTTGPHAYSRALGAWWNNTQHTQLWTQAALCSQQPAEAGSDLFRKDGNWTVRIHGKDYLPVGLFRIDGCGLKKPWWKTHWRAAVERQEKLLQLQDLVQESLPVLLVWCTLLLITFHTVIDAKTQLTFDTATYPCEELPSLTVNTVPFPANFTPIKFYMSILMKDFGSGRADV